jgi:CBS domain-containing protein
MIAAHANLLSLSAKDLMTTDVLHVHQEMSVKDAALLLVKNGISGAPVVDDKGRCIGVFSSTDLLRNHTEQKHPRTTPLERPVTCPFVRTLRDLQGCETSLCTLSLGSCPIQRGQKDADGTPRVICSEPHAVPVEWSVVEMEQLPEDPVQVYMTTDPVTVHGDVGIQTVARMMIDAHIHRLIVVDPEERPVGVVSTSDILASIAYASEP